MTAFLIAGALFGLILGRFFKVYVLVPACALVTVLAFTGPHFIGKSLGSSFVDILVWAPQTLGLTDKRRVFPHSAREIALTLRAG